MKPYHVGKPLEVYYHWSLPQDCFPLHCRLTIRQSCETSQHDSFPIPLFEVNLIKVSCIFFNTKTRMIKFLQSYTTAKC